MSRAKERGMERAEQSALSFFVPVSKREHLCVSMVAVLCSLKTDEYSHC